MSEFDRDLPFSERQAEAAVALEALWPDLDKDQMVARYLELLRSPSAKCRLREWAERDEERDTVLAEARELLLPGLLHVEQRYTQIPRQLSAIFNRVETVVDVERASEVGGHFVYNIENRDVELECAITRRSIDDNSCWTMFAPILMGLAESFHQTEEIRHANLLNSGHVYNPSSIGDGCPLFYDRHPIAGGSYSNVCNYPLSEAAVENVAIKIMELTDQAGLPVMVRPIKLVVPIALQFAAHRIMLAAAEDRAPGFPQGYCVLDYLTDPTAWFVTTSAKGLHSMHRRPFKLDAIADGGNLILEGSQSYGVGHHNPRACFASYPDASEDAVRERTARAAAQLDAQMARMSARHNEVAR